MVVDFSNVVRMQEYADVIGATKKAEDKTPAAPQDIQTEKVSYNDTEKDSGILLIQITLSGTEPKKVIGELTTPDIMSQCLEICRKQGLTNPCLNTAGYPFPSHRDGTPIHLTLPTDKPDVAGRHYYTVIHRFLGDNG
jgi:hypothetical protein